MHKSKESAGKVWLPATELSKEIIWWCEVEDSVHH